jgi:hypothetical protein
MVAAIAWRPAYRIIDSRYPFEGIYDRVADPALLPDLIAIEALTNERLLDEAGTLALVRPKDRVSGPGTTPIMAAFTHARSSRFSDGSFGVYYAAKHRRTAIAEVRHHKTIFLAETAQESTDLDMRLYAADVRGAFDDLRRADRTDPRLDPDSYATSQRYAAERRGRRGRHRLSQRARSLRGRRVRRGVSAASDLELHDGGVSFVSLERRRDHRGARQSGDHALRRLSAAARPGRSARRASRGWRG